jgi:SAM-dependent methyltransferase
MDLSQFELHAKFEDSHWWFKARREIILDQLKKYVPADNGRLIAEIGCGTGGNLKVFEKYYEVLGIDIAPEAVKHAAQRVPGRVFLGDFREVFSGKSLFLDAVILADVLEHIDDHENFLKDLIPFLKEGAILVITVPAHDWLWSHHDVVLGHRRRYSRRILCALWKNLPLKEVKFTPVNFFLFPPIAIFRMLKINAFNSGGSDLALPAPLMNTILYKIFSIERFFLRYFFLPFGVSYLAVLKKTRD